MSKAQALRERLVRIALEWEDYLAVAPAITTAISELDAAITLVGMPEDLYCADGKPRTAVTRGKDFIWNNIRYQITANRPSGKPGSPVTLVSRKHEGKRAFEWDRSIWVLYDRGYIMQEAWEFDVTEYRRLFAAKKRLSPKDRRQGRRLWPR